MQKFVILFAFSSLLLVPIVALNSAYGDDFDSRRDTYISLRGDFTLLPPPLVDTRPITIIVIGDPLLPGESDTIVQRDPSPVPPQGSSTGPIQTEMIQLELKSLAPITVPLTGSWEVKVELDLPPFPTGILTATKLHENGGTYSSSLPIEPKFIFTRVSDSMVTEQTYDMQLDIIGQPWGHFPCPNSFFPIGPINWAISGTVPSQGQISGTLLQDPVPPDDQCLVAGKILKLDSTSLLLAGFQSNAIWLLPVVLAGVGIVVFKLRKF